MRTIWLTLILLTVEINCLQDESFIPDLTLLSRKRDNGFEYICAAGKNVRDSAIIFKSNLKNNIEDYVFSNYHTKDDRNNYNHVTGYNCNFDNPSCEKDWTSHIIHKVIDSEDNSFSPYVAPIIDERWEKFQSHSVTQNGPLKLNLSASKTFTFSFQSKNGSALLLYNANINDDQSFYYIELKESVIVFECENQNINSIDLQNCREIKTNGIISVDLKMWQHFLIIINQKISIFKYDANNEKRIEFDNMLNVRIDKMKFKQEKTKHNIGSVKMHKNKFLSIDPNSYSYELGSYLQTVQNSALCVEFYALTCKDCIIEFSLGENTKKIVEGNPQQFLQSWQYVRLFIPAQIKDKSSYRLKVKNLKFNSPEFWAIDDIRICHENEYRSISMKTTDEINISCQSLKHPSVLVSKKIEQKDSAICRDYTKIGNNCDVSCEAITKEYSCNNYRICKLNKQGKSECSCAFGYKGRYCANKSIPYLRDSVALINTTINSVTVRLESHIIEEKDMFEVDAFGIEYKDKNAATWISTNRKYRLSTNETITIPNLKGGIEYSIRGILYSPYNKFINEEKIKTASFQTSCKNVSYFVEHLQCNVGETYANIIWDPICDNQINFEINCVKNKQNLEWCKEPELRNLKKIKNLSKQYNLEGLSPFSNYELIVKNDNSEINSTYSFITKPSEQQTAVQNLNVFARSDKLISIRWRPPHINDKISYYERFYKKCNAHYVSKKYSSISVAPCNIWPEWLCHEITDTSPTDCYEIHIRGYYNDRVKAGYEKNITIEPNKVSSPPENITFNSDTSSICWNYPNFIQGKLNSFLVHVVPINSALLNGYNEPFFTNLTAPDKPEYCVIVNSLDLSSTYEIRIQTESTENLSDNKILEINTDPIVPELMTDIVIGMRTNSTQEITIPQIKPKTNTINSVIYVRICNNNNHPKVYKTCNSKFDNLTTCNGVAWIVAKFIDTKHEHNFIIGNLSKYGEEICIENMPLNQSISYNIEVILINEYKGQERYKIYTGKINSFEEVPGWNPLYLLLLLLLFIPIIAFFVYKKTANQFSIPSFNYGFTTRRNNNRNLLPLNKLGKNERENISISAPLIKTNKAGTIENKGTTSNNFSCIVKVENFSQYVKNSLENGELQRQHELLKKGGLKPWEYGMIKENKFKNRYNNLTAYDHSRVILGQMQGDPFSDFINANYIDGYKQEKAYIATQGPKPNTINDFWRMIWQEKVQFIVMLANLTEGGKKKCEKYWPEMGVTQEYVNLSITYVKSDIYADFEYRTFEVVNGQEKRLVQHLHFTSWPDHGVPLYPQSLVPFLRYMATISVDVAPVVVHCSAGVGRTGTIILTDICLRMAAAENQIDAFKYLHVLRENRANMVDNFNQYKLVHMVLLEYLLAPETNIPCNENMAALIENIIETGTYQKQLDYLEATAWHNKTMTTATELNPENATKNRFPLIVPGHTRIYISRYPYSDENSDYINAIPVDGFRIKEQFIVTQNPLPNTLKDFWRMVNEHNCNVIVSLNDFKSNDESCTVFWPTANEELKPMPHFIIQHKAETSFDYFDVIKVQITNQNAEEGNEVSSVKIIQFKKWERGAQLPENPISLINLFEEAQCSSRGGNPMLITCFDGTTACGVFVALSFVIEKIKLEQLCDVSLATRVIRCNREQFIINWHQFVFLYKAALEYVNGFEEYGNFQGPSME